MIVVLQFPLGFALVFTGFRVWDLTFGFICAVGLRFNLWFWDFGLPFGVWLYCCCWELILVNLLCGSFVFVWMLLVCCMVFCDWFDVGLLCCGLQVW